MQKENGKGNKKLRIARIRSLKQESYSYKITKSILRHELRDL